MPFPIGREICCPQLEDRAWYRGVPVYYYSTRVLLETWRGGDDPIGGGLGLGMKHRESSVPEVRTVTFLATTFVYIQVPPAISTT